MITKLYFHVINSESMNFDSDIHMTNEQYDEMTYENFQKNQYMMKDFERYGFSIKNNMYYNAYNDAPELFNNNEKEKYSECEAFIQIMNSNKNFYSAEESNFYELLENGKLSIMTININPNSLEYDAESELRLWIGESNRINSDKNLDLRTKHMSLPKRDIRVKINENTILLMNNCKMIGDNSNSSYPFNLTIAVELITEN